MPILFSSFCDNTNQILCIFNLYLSVISFFHLEFWHQKLRVGTYIYIKFIYLRFLYFKVFTYLHGNWIIIQVTRATQSICKFFYFLIIFVFDYRKLFHHHVYLQVRLNKFVKNDFSLPSYLSHFFVLRIHSAVQDL